MSVLIPRRILLADWLQATVLCFLTSVLSLPATDQSIPAELLILADSPEFEDLLIPKLDGIRIVTRQALPAIARESLLSGEKLHLVGARTVLILEGTPPNLVGRLVDAESGGTITEYRPPELPLAQLAEWFALRVPEFVDRSASSDQAKFALLGLRFDLDSPENRIAERQANLLFAAELQKAGAMVLERWRMRDLVFEKNLMAAESPFWKAATLLSGSLSRTDNGFVLHLQAERPGGPVRKWEIRGESLDQVVTKAVRALADTASQTLTETSGHCESEAFLQEARWLLNHGLPLEAWQAVEAAIALGANGPSPETLRIQAAAMTAYPDNLQRPETFDGGYERDAITLGELPRRVAAATEASLLAGDYIRKYPTPQPPVEPSREHPAVLGVNSLYTGLRVLRFAHDSGWWRENQDAVRELRSALQRQIALLQAIPLHFMEHHLYSYLTNYAAYWNETPQETIALYRKVLDPEFRAGKADWPKSVREELAFDSSVPHPPFLVAENLDEDFRSGIGAWRVVAWDGSDPTAVWRDFLEEWSRSPLALERADALALRWQSTASEKERWKITRQMVDFLHDEFATMQGPLGPAIFHAFYMPLRDVNADKFLASSQQKLVDFFFRLLRSDQPLPHGIVPLISSPFSDGRLNASPEQAEQLLQAISKRMEALARVETRQLAAARSALQQIYPNLRPTQPDRGKTLVARGPWIAWEHFELSEFPSMGFSNENAVWFDGALRVIDPHHGQLWSIDPVSGNTSILHGINAPDVNSSPQLLVWNDSLVVTTKTGVSILDWARQKWTALELPPARYVAAVVAGDLWVASGETQEAGRTNEQDGTRLFRIGADRKPNLIASSRRRPALHPLDGSLKGNPFVILPSSSGGVLIGCWGGDATLLDSENGTAPTALNQYGLGNIQLSSHPQIVVRIKHKDGAGNRISRIDLFDPAGMRLLLSHPQMDGAENARFPYPDGLDAFAAGQFTVAWDGERLGILAWSSKGSPWGATEAKLFQISENGHTESDVRFPFDTALANRFQAARRDAKAFRYPHPDPKGLIPTPHGYAVLGRAMEGFWFLPMDAIRSAAQDGKQ